MLKQQIGSLTRRQAVRLLVGPMLAGLIGRATGAGPERSDSNAPARLRVLLSVTGAIGRTNAPDGARRYDFTAEAFDALPVQEIRTSTPWHKGVSTYSGPFLADVLAQVGASGSLLQMTALNDYQVRMPASEVLPFRPIIARRVDGALMTVRNKGPLFMIFPFDELPQTRNDLVYSRAIWQLTAIEVR